MGREQGAGAAPVWGFGGGKGGVGKSVTALNAATYLALGGRQVVLVDGDLGSPNLHTLLGLRNPATNLSFFIHRKIDRLEDALYETCVPGLSLIPGSRDTFGAANPKYLQKLRFLRHLAALEADLVILDLGAGTSFHTLDLFNAVSHRVVVLTPEPTSLQNAYGFVKMALYRRIVTELGRSREANPGVRETVTRGLEGDGPDRVQNVGELLTRLDGVDPRAAARLREILATSRVSLVVNMASEAEGKAVGETLGQVSREFLQIRCEWAGHVGADPAVMKSVRRMRPHILENRHGFRGEEIARVLRAVEAQAAAPPVDEPFEAAGRAVA